MTIGLHNWMECLYSDIQDVPINRLKIPGSHRSGSFGITNESPIDPVASHQNTFRIFKGLIKRWSKTQNLDIDQQLYAGIRYFDISVQKYNGRFMFTNNLLGTNLVQGLSQMKEFIDANKNEIIICHLRELKGLDILDYYDLFRKIKKVFGFRLANKDNFSPTDPINKFVNLNKRIIVSCESFTDDDFWGANSVISKSTKESNPLLVGNYLLQKLAERSMDDKRLNIQQGVLFSSLWGYKSRQNYAKKINKELINWVPHMDNINCLMYDVVEFPMLTWTIILQNKKK